jgi:hypothetical protein
VVQDDAPLADLDDLAQGDVAGGTGQAEAALDAAVRLDDARLRQHLEDLGQEGLGNLAGARNQLELDRGVVVASRQFLETTDGVFGLAGDLEHCCDPCAMKPRIQDLQAK